jgi:hypothetical protein
MFAGYPDHTAGDVGRDSESKPTAIASLPDPDQSLVDFKKSLNEPTLLAEADADAGLSRKLVDLAVL